MPAGGCRFLKPAQRMKHLIIAIVALTSLTVRAQTGVDAMAKQRAKDVANQNNNRSMEPPGATPAAPAPRPGSSMPTVTATPLNASQQTSARFQSEMFLATSHSTPRAPQ